MWGRYGILDLSTQGDFMFTEAATIAYDIVKYMTQDHRVSRDEMFRMVYDEAVFHMMEERGPLDPDEKLELKDAVCIILDTHRK